MTLLKHNYNNIIQNIAKNFSTIKDPISLQTSQIVSQFFNVFAHISIKMFCLGANFVFQNFLWNHH